MLLDALLMAKPAEAARQAEVLAAARVDGIFTFEGPHDVFLPRIEPGALPRSPPRSAAPMPTATAPAASKRWTRPRRGVTMRPARIDAGVRGARPHLG